MCAMEGRVLSNCLGAVLSIIIGSVKIPYAAAESGMIAIKTWIYKALLMPVCGDDATLAWSILPPSWLTVCLP